MPAARQRSPSSAKALAVIARIGTKDRLGNCRMARVACSPSITGKELVRRLRGLLGPLNALRQAALQARPAIGRFAGARQPLERHLRCPLKRPLDVGLPSAGAAPAPQASFKWALHMATGVFARADRTGVRCTQPMYRHVWTGHLMLPPTTGSPGIDGDGPSAGSPPSRQARSARLSGRPDAGPASEDEDDAHQGAWMIQASQRHRHAGDPFGMQRPTDRDEDGAADEYAESLADLEQVRPVSTPGQAKEVGRHADSADRGRLCAGRCARHVCQARVAPGGRQVAASGGSPNRR